jgi:predicted SnoaL-like aldol condensation-catalyzing enzyme
MRRLARVLGVLLLCAAAPPAAAQSTATTRATIDAFHKMAYDEKRLIEATKLYFSSDFIEHAPVIDGGNLEGLLKRFETRQVSDVRDDVIRVIAEGELAAVHHYQPPQNGKPGKVFVDIFRVREAKIVEHWDVSQVETKNPANPHTMY